jgi:imidazolonepropionase-like amidohydrolase
MNPLPNPFEKLLDRFGPPPLPRERLLLTDVDVLDPRDGAVREGQDVLIHDGAVQAVGPAGELPADGATVLPGEGRTAGPGLIDTHLHACGTYAVDRPTARDLAAMPEQIRRNLQVLVESGVTTVRDMGAPLRLIGWLRRRAEEGRLRAPRILASGPVITAPGGYPAFMEPLRPPLTWLLGQIKAEVRTEAEAIGWVDRVAAHGLDCVKVMYTSADYDDARSPLPLLSEALVRALTDRAHHHGLPVAVHHVWRRDLDRLLELPFDSLEHLSIDEPMTDADLERIVGRGLPVSTTLMTYGTVDFLAELEALLEHDAEGRYTAQARRTLLPLARRIAAGDYRIPFIGRRVIQTGMTHMLDSLRRLREAGARVVAGTDQGGSVTPCGLIRWELQSMLRAGFTPLAALQTATCEAARALGRPELGCLARDHPADVILTRGNPATDLEALSRVDLVIRDGRVLSNRLGAQEPTGPHN